MFCVFLHFFRSVLVKKISYFAFSCSLSRKQPRFHSNRWHVNRIFQTKSETRKYSEWSVIIIIGIIIIISIMSSSSIAIVTIIIIVVTALQLLLRLRLLLMLLLLLLLLTSLISIVLSTQLCLETKWRSNQKLVTCTLRQNGVALLLTSPGINQRLIIAPLLPTSYITKLEANND